MRRLRLRVPTIGPASRVALGLVALMVSILMLADLFVTGFLPDRTREAKERRTLAAQLVATQISHALQLGDTARLQPILAQMLQQTPELRSAALRVDGLDDRVLASAGDPAAHWHLAPGLPSTLDQLRTTILADGVPWGRLELAFAPAQPRDWRGWLAHPMVRGGALLMLLGFVAFQLYLRRAMRYLDPESAVPERVRTAFDTLVEGVLVLDQAGRVMLVNSAIRGLHPAARDLTIGTEVGALDWLVAAVAPLGGEPPWVEVLQHHRASLGHQVRITVPDGRAREVVLNASPIDDGRRRARGCLLTFSDVTELQERTERLRVALAELSASQTEIERQNQELLASQAEIERQNEELMRLATRDPMTGCLNRRSFMADADRRFAQALDEATPLACIMCDIDHFKSINDRFGHAAGDQVIQAAAKALSRGLRVGDFLGRYGGEEFCIMLPGATLAQAMEIGERLRADVEANVGSAMRDHPGIRVTMSFGAALLESDVADPAALIDQADQALYYSKKNGRNRVTSWPAAREAQRQAASALETA